jgi:hypothetical protein
MSHSAGTTGHISSISYEVETIETVIEQPAEAVTSTEPAPVAGKSTTVVTKSFQVTITLDADTHEHFRSLAEADDRSLNKYLARELRAAYLSQK